MESEMENVATHQTHAFGVLITLLACLVFWWLLTPILGAAAWLAAPIVTLIAARPAREDAPWLWQRRTAWVEPCLEEPEKPAA